MYNDFIYYVIICQEKKYDAFSYYQFLVELTLRYWTLEDLKVGGGSGFGTGLKYNTCARNLPTVKNAATWNEQQKTDAILFFLLPRYVKKSWFVTLASLV